MARSTATTGRLTRGVRRAALGFGDQARRRSTTFYLGLAILFALAIAAGFVWSLTGPGIKSSSIDIAVRTRLSSPAPDPDILIVDIDERSLAQLAPEHGRWPWPRSVLAEQIAGLQAAGASAILLNLTLSDPDRDHPQDDATFAEVVRQVRPVAFPVTRLDPANDRLSAVAMTRFPGVVVRDREAAARPRALIVPAFPDTFDRLGFNTLTVDPDGVIRRFQPWISEPGFAFPSQALRTLQLAGRAPLLTPTDPPGGRILNWRNKRGDYARMSFSDVARALDEGKPAGLAPFRGKIIILGASATGVGAVRATAAKPLTDDGTILATAMDDMLHGTQLRLVPAWATAGLSILVLFSLAAAFILRVNAGLINTIFVVLQSGFIVVTVYFASYTNYLIDISTTILLALAYFSIAKVYASVHLNATRGNPSFSAFVDRCGEAPLVIAGVSRTGTPQRRVRSLLRRAEKRFGVENVLHIDNLFSEGHALESATRPYSFLLVSCRAEPVAGAQDALRAISERERVTLALGAPLLPAVDTPEGAADRPARVRGILKALLQVVDQMVEAQPVR